jgi:organic hydroperoxide reductase OsmC/OhrA
MAEFKINLKWQLDTTDFEYKTYTRTHQISFPGGQTLTGSAAPEFFGKPELVNPEEAFLAALSSCHMLTFLAIACKMKFTPESYLDDAVATMTKNAKGKFFVSEAVLRPKIKFIGPKIPTAIDIAKLHERAHEECFIANSIITEVKVDI